MDQEFLQEDREYLQEDQEFLQEDREYLLKVKKLKILILISSKYQRKCAFLTPPRLCLHLALITTFLLLAKWSALATRLFKLLNIPNNNNNNFFNSNSFNSNNNNNNFYQLEEELVELLEEEQDQGPFRESNLNIFQKEYHQEHKSSQAIVSYL